MAISRIESNSIAPSQTLTTPIIATTMGVGGATPAGSGSGITFPATQSASTDVNTLDDYEEGSFSPIFSQTDGTTTGLTYSVQVGKYTKVGNLVSVQGYVRLTSKASLTGNVKFGGMPFANISTTNAYAAPAIPAFLDTTGITVYGGLFGDFSPGATNMTLYYGNGAAGANLTFTNLQNTFGLEFNFTYVTAT